MKYKEYPPHESLNDYVKCLWVMERRYTPEHPTEDVTPDAFIHLQKGRLRMTELAERCQLSGRQLQRQFQDVVGRVTQGAGAPDPLRGDP